MSRALILGCGTIGTLVGEGLVSAGWQVIGVRRSASPAAPFPMVAGDISAPDLLGTLPQAVDAVLLCATPGLRRGRDHGLAAAARLIAGRHPAARLVYTGSTAVYGDAAGGGVDEAGPLATGDPAVRGLLDIEQAILDHRQGLVLRVAGLVGPTRTHALERIRTAARDDRPCIVKGDPDRPFSYLHELDCAGLCLMALAGGLGTGMLNAAVPERLTVREYFQLLARRIGVTVTVAGDGAAMPSRWIDARRLWRMCPEHAWRRVDASS